MEFEELKMEIGRVSVSLPRREQRVFIETEDAAKVYDQLVVAEKQRVQVLKGILC